MPSFQPVKGERSELSTMDGRTMAMGRSRPRRARRDSPRLFVKVYVFGQPRCCARRRPTRASLLRAQRARLRFRTPASSPAGAEASLPPRPSAWRRSALSSSGPSARSSTRRMVSRSESISLAASNCESLAGLIVLQLFGDAAVAHADNVAGRKMHQAGVIALSQKVEQVDRGIDVGRERIAHIRIEIRQTGAVHDEVE